MMCETAYLVEIICNLINCLICYIVRDFDVRVITLSLRDRGLSHMRLIVQAKGVNCLPLWCILITALSLLSLMEEL